MGTLQDSLTPQGLDLASRIEQAMAALRCPPPDADVTISPAVAAPRRVVQAACCRRRTAAARRATNNLDAESVVWLEQH